MTWRYQAPELLTQASCSRSKLSLVPVESYPVKFLIVAQSGRFSFGQQRFLHATCTALLRSFSAIAPSTLINKTCAVNFATKMAA